jgi:hypothetical protein
MHYEMRSTYPTLTRIDWLKIDSDALSSKRYVGLFSYPWHGRSFSSDYLVSVYGIRILDHLASA